MKRIWLPLILLTALILRVLWLDKLPQGFTPDEASFGYDAYSILKTGKDQWGTAFPLVLQSFGDYKSPLYAYLTIPFVAVFGLNKFAVRLPNALLGTFAVLVTYLLVRELFKEKKLAIIASFLLAISPWHIMLSRGAFESNLTTFFMPLGTYLFLKGLRYPKYFVFSALAFGLNLFTYHSAKLVTPLVFFALTFLYRKQLIQWIRNRSLKLSFFVLLIFLGLTFYTFTQGAGARINERLITNGALDEAAVYRIEAVQKGMPDSIAHLLHNKYQVTVNRFLTNYFSYFTSKFFFKNGPAEATYGMIPGIGVLYGFELLFLLGLFISIFKRKMARELILIIIWVILSPVPAALSTGVGYSANRVAVMMPAIYIFLSFGAYEVYRFFKFRLPKNSLRLTVYVFGVFSFYTVVIFLKAYFINPPEISAKAMLSGNLEMAYWLKNNLKEDENILITRKLSEPQIYIAFAYKFDPNIYQSYAKEWDYKRLGVNWVDQIPEYSLNNFTFKNIDWRQDLGKYDLYVGEPEEFLKDQKELKVFYYPDKTVAIKVFSK
ncbi:hypothetical protein A3D00_02195 [Candidatus Woesebacteria bacterium RIFCSPHIGHO2_02_FULL_38_9]|nr:MAG: hypothetical protein A3D00_02195 [Candidatus Woesebacteria bacterium RIFCSPHIGHO2_02_FULL_38_9]OGM57810.1 MAG: hypothetical protein A3A50_02240 [Candidatus Woesebacteria bacterium RIFCSPLOWO2_01_FULL_38_20]